MNEPALSTSPESFGRYLLYPAIARGGMATVHTARLVGAEGFTRLVAAKRLHPQFTDDPDFVTMFHDEACIASRIHHPNVVPVLDVVLSGHELILVQEYVHGVPLSQLMKLAHASKAPIPVDIAVAVLTGVLAGLHAAHEVKDEDGRSLDIVHRDVSPQNIMISVDGIPRLLDFGIAKARTSTHHTREGVFKGKLAYMAPEQIRMDGHDRTIDVYATGVLAWELLVNRRIYDGRREIQFVTAVMDGEIPKVTEALAELRSTIDDARWEELVRLEDVVLRAMAPRSEDRFASAEEMMMAILAVRPAATAMVISEWVRSAGAEFLDQRRKTLAANEESWRRTSVYPPTPSSGTQRSNPVTGGPTLVIDTPSSIALVGSSTRSSAPPTVMSPSAAPPSDSGEYRMALGVSPLARLNARLGGSRVVPWLTAGTLVVAGILGGVVRGVADPAPAAGAPAVAEGAALPAITATSASPYALPAAAPSPPPARAAVPPITPPSNHDAMFASPVQSAAPPPPAPRPVHVAPPPPRVVFITRPAPPAPAPSAQAESKPDCTPPFYFDGTKKVFKPSCL